MIISRAQDGATAPLVKQFHEEELAPRGWICIRAMIPENEM